MLGGMEASAEERNWRRLQTTGLHGTFKDVLERMQNMLNRLEQAQELIAREALLSKIFLRSERGLSLAIGQGAAKMDTSMHLVWLAQKARADVNTAINGESVDISSLTAPERQAVELASSKKWVRSSKDREALLEIYENLFSHIDQQMSVAG